MSQPSILRREECEVCGAETHPTAQVLLNVPPDGATMREWVCGAGHSAFVVVR